MMNKNVLKMMVALFFVSLLFAAQVMAAPRTFTIKGRVLDPDGRPVAGAPLQFTPLTPTTGWDVANAFYKIPNYDWHRTVTNQDGEFVMQNVIDYPENYTHRYLIQSLGGYNGLHIVLMISLPTGPVPPGQEHQILDYTINAQHAAQLTVTLKDSDGKPFTGKKVVYIQTGHNVSDGRFGVGFFVEADFRNGVYKRAQVLKPDRYGRVAILQFDTEAQARTTLLARGLKVNDSTDAYAFALKDASGKPVAVELNWTPGDVKLDFQLP